MTLHLTYTFPMRPRNSLNSFDVLGVRIDEVQPSTVFPMASGCLERGGYICLANVATIVECQHDPLLRTAIANADLVLPDGAPIAWAGRLQGRRNVRRTCGRDLMLHFFDEGRPNDYSHFLLGSTTLVCAALKTNLESRFPGVRIVGTLSPFISTLNLPASSDDIDSINKAGPDVVWVAFGSPKQEIWMFQHRSVLRAKLLVGVGAAFDFLAGSKPTAPRWLQRWGLEWLFRLCCEPRRLAKRYVIGNAVFLFLLLRAARRSLFRQLPPH